MNGLVSIGEGGRNEAIGKYGSIERTTFSVLASKQ